MYFLVNPTFWFVLFGVTAIVVIGGLVLEDNIKHMPAPFQAWWKRHICDDYDNIWPNG